MASSLYAPRVPIFPRRVSGFYRRLKWQIMALTLAVYYLTPLLRWDRGPALPDQAVLVDLANRRFYFLWIEIWPHEFYFVAGLLIMAGLGLFLFTAALGRVWCGYTCPQTVWTDLFLLVERRVEGDRNARLRLHQAPWSARKARLRLTKWTLWLVISVLTGGAWVFYLADAPMLARDLATFSAPPVAWATIALLTATTFTFGGFMREQICIYACPWPRIQGAMMDEGTLTVAYRDRRGEPRGRGLKRKGGKVEAPQEVTRAAGPQIGGRSPVLPLQIREGRAVLGAAPGAGAEGPGDCIDCNACVNVCPMGIDIRDGQQMACITCALCIDACDEVMEKVGRPRGLIDYVALSDAGAEQAEETPLRRSVLRPRNILYFGLWAAIGAGLIAALLLRPMLQLTVAPVRNPTFVTLSDGSIRNAYDLRLRNREGAAQEIALTLEGPEALVLSVEGAGTEAVPVQADTQRAIRVYVTAAPGTAPAEAARTGFEIAARDAMTGETARIATTFTGEAR
ncbi:4Fe-4S dicluster domain-containing protein [Pseudoroseicyclus aestuarii]|uniref:Cytochrome c oxidase accessory protein FixG n=1 Tax=Pseudoroseicyclus aestuarii TaxID=1795041 RepID=A0A318SNP5_9RHOB|nr:4Fe-4S dicluster domain-containing protein [Pseudoroseicyclus aestuarii]PYE82454.1 cytochrome c oxidase accessory protein FixG [Pseudoroseicyclus aestuarii]